MFKDLIISQIWFSVFKLENFTKQISLRKARQHCNPNNHFKITQHLWILLVLGCSKVFVATMSGKLGPISFHIPSGCTLVVCTTQGFNPKATGPMTSGKNQRFINGANQEQQTIRLIKETNNSTQTINKNKAKQLKMPVNEWCLYNDT